MGIRFEEITINHLQDIALHVMDCAMCGVIFAMPKHLERERRADHGNFYCPNGHVLIYSQRSEAERLRDELRAAEEREARTVAYWRAEYAQEAERKQRVERQLSATKGQLTRTRKRVQNGVCPACNRTFQNLARHMHGQHPQFADDDRAIKEIAPKL